MFDHTVKSAGATDAQEKLCFDKNEFMQANFSVDEFLHKNRNAPSLEQLRDNLGLYLKGLRASMIDLINEDYADFVSLSANLVGLDQSIEAIQRPLEQFQNEIGSIQSLIEENVNEIREYLNEKRQIREKKRNLQSLRKVQEAISKLEDLLAHQLSETLRAVDLERAALELIQLKFNEKFCATLLNEDQHQTINKLYHEVLKKLRAFFSRSLQSASSTQTEHLERCLRIYITLDECHTAEAVFRDDVVAPYMNDIISEHCLQNCPQGLGGVYNKILNFISLHMTDLLRLTQYTDKLRGFNFLVNSFWADVEMRLETHMTSIFAPGNAEAFYARYKCSREFVTKIEELLATEEAIQAFRLNKQTKSFQTRWNLPVYFQIRFQEIAGEFEAVLEPIIPKDIADATSAPNTFRLAPFTSAWKAIQRCWSAGVFLSEVFPKFYKLNVQIMLRLSRWITDLLRVLKTSKQNLGSKLSKTNLLISLYVDIQNFVEILSEMKQLIFKNIPKEKQTSAVNEAIEKSFSNFHHILKGHLSTIRDCLKDILTTECGVDNVRQVNDLPRLYRKTNREVPTRSSAYVEQMLRPLKAFVAQQSTQLDKEVVGEVLRAVCEKLTADYYAVVSDVLTSVQKTEESLKRLRNLKSSASTSQLSQQTISDDDKIRLQLRVDVATWTSELSKLNLMPTDIDKLIDLNNIVEESIKQKEAVNN